MARRKTPRVLVATLAAAAVAAVSYKIYEALQTKKPGRRRTESMALTLSHSVLNSGLPLAEMLASENVTFILPPYLSVDDLACRIGTKDSAVLYDLPESLVRNYKLLRCANFEGYVHVLKNLQPDTLFVCMDDLGVGQFPADMRRFVKEIVTFGQDRGEVSATLTDAFGL